MKHILLTNDDGTQAPGLKCLEESLGSVGEVTVVAPDKEMSVSGVGAVL
jgi:5'-nucleotidase